MAANNWIATTSTDYGVAGNWSDGVPTAADTVALENSNIGMDANLNQSAVALTSWIAYSSYTGRIGVLNLTSTPGVAGTYLQIDTALLVLGRHISPGVPFGGIGALPGGSPRMMIDIGATTACAVIVESTAMAGSDQWLPPVRLKANKTTHTLEVRRGFVGVAVGRSDETSTLGTITTGTSGGRRQDSRLTLGPGVTINTKLNVVSGEAYVLSAYPAADLFGGVTYWDGAGAVSGNIVIWPGARLIANSTGTVSGTITIKPGGTLDLSQSNAARNYGTISYDNSQDFIDNNVVTATRTPTGKGKGGGGGAGA